MRLQLLLCACVCAFATAKKDPIVTLLDGSLVEGKAKEFGPILDKRIIHTFLGIPFAKPPVGDLRFKAPVTPMPWGKKTFLAHKQGPSCAQLDVFKGERLGKEDCLTLDVTVPHQCIDSKQPCAVMTWYYGGAWELGSVEEFGIYDPKELATKYGVIVVAGNYRLDVVGWLAHKVFEEEDPDHSYGSYGFRDQTMVLKWVQDNIHAFNGDPMKVTIFGESAGGFSVCSHLVSPASSGLFSNAIIESGGCDESGLLYFDGADAKIFGDGYVRALRCNRTTAADTRKCMRGLETKDLMQPYINWLKPFFPNNTEALAQSRRAFASFMRDHVPLSAGGPGGGPYWPRPRPAFAPFIAWGPVIDGSDVSLPDAPLSLISKGKIAVAPSGDKVNVIMGTNNNEGSLFMIGLPLVVPGLPPSSVSGVLSDNETNLVLETIASYQQNWPANAVDVLKGAYPKADYPPGNATNINRIADVITDLTFKCAARRTVRALAAKGNPVWLYNFEHHFFGFKSLESCGSLLYLLCGDYHGSEVKFVWQHRGTGLDALSKKDKIMQETFGQYWTNLAKFGDPNGGSPSPLFWPRYNRSEDQHMILKEPGLAVGSRLRQDTCDLLDKLGHFQ